MKVLGLSWSDDVGGAAKAAYRVHESLRTNHIESSLFVLNKRTEDSMVHVFSPNLLRKLQVNYAKILARILKKYNLVSLNKFGVITSEIINNSDCDLVHINWINNETISLLELLKIRKPIVLTLHDMWFINGIEHYDLEVGQSRVKLLGSLHAKLNEEVMRLQFEFLTKPNVTIVVPNSWLKLEIRKRFKENLRVSVVPLALNTDVWKPSKSDEVFDPGLSVLFGAVGGTSDFRKGFDILLDSLQYLDTRRQITIYIFGQSMVDMPSHKNVKFIFKGHLVEQKDIIDMYNRCCVFAMPSRRDNSPLTIMESLACGTPVVAFDSSGMSYMIDHRENGYLADPFDPKDFADGINFCLYNRKEILSRELIAQRMSDSHSYTAVSKKLVALYRGLI